MPEIIIRRCDGGTKGELCKTLIDNAFKSFFSCGIKKIEELCNLKRGELIKEWQDKKPNDNMSEYKLPSISFGQGIKEIISPFELYEPEIIEVFILEGERSQGNNGLAAMDIRPLDNEGLKWELHAYLDVMDYSNNELKWRGFKESIEEITYHELLHAYGDIPRRGKHDGILRHNLIGITCVKKCIEERM